MNLLPLRTVLEGIWMDPARYVANPILNHLRPSRPCRARCRGVAGASHALHALRLHANDPITMYAQLLTRSSTGVVRAPTPLLSWAIKFSWSQRSLAEDTTSSAVISRSLVM